MGSTRETLSITLVLAIAVPTLGAAQGPPAPSDFYTVIPPCRTVDTRQSSGEVNCGGHWGPILSGGPCVVQITGHCGVPVAATAVSVSLVVVAPTGEGSCRLYPPGGGVVPLASAISYSAGRTRTSNGLFPLDESGQLVVRCTPAGHVLHFVLDVNGYFK